MAGNTVITKRKVESRTKVKTGCKTCRIRKIRCDEGKPLCNKCVVTGRTCDGYETPFRTFTSHRVSDAHTQVIKPSSNFDLQLIIQSNFIEITPRNINLLGRCFSTKTLFDVKLDCDEEARQVLQASSNYSPIRHAIFSLKSLREDLEISGDGPLSAGQHTSSFHYGLQQYSMALRGLAFSLSSMGSNGVRPALLCCQILISIEQVRKNYSAMAQHIIRGLMIMHEYRGRPVLVSMNQVVSAHQDKLPFLDVFVIKLFAAPCKFAETPPTADVSETTSSKCSLSPFRRTILSRDLRTIVPNNRTELIRISALTIIFLGKVSRVKSVEIALQLISEKAALLGCLESWLFNLDFSQTTTASPNPEPISVSFLRMFHLILRITLLGSLETSPKTHMKLQSENERLQSFAGNLGERVQDYVTCNGRQGRPAIR